VCVLFCFVGKDFSVCSIDSIVVICFCREASVALNVWQPEVVRGRQKQMVEQCVVPAESRIHTLEMELRLCKQHILGLEKSYVSVDVIYYKFWGWRILIEVVSVTYTKLYSER